MGRYKLKLYILVAALVVISLLLLRVNLLFFAIG